MPKAVIDNERKACDAIVRAIEHLKGQSRVGAFSPEDDGLESDVEYVCEIGGTAHAFEHTTVEAFEGQIRSNVSFEKFGPQIEAELDGKLSSPAHFQLYFDINPTDGLKPPRNELNDGCIVVFSR